MEDNKTVEQKGNCQSAGASGYKELAEENERLKAALNYIALLSNMKNPHLGHPRAGEIDCVFCMAFFALNNGAYGHSITKDDYISLFNAKKESS